MTAQHTGDAPGQRPASDRGRGPAVRSLNVGRPRQVPLRGGWVRTAIRKSPVDGRLRVQGVNVEGDAQADRTVHGGPDKAIYAYASEDLDLWSGELGRTIEAGTFGENLTTVGIDLAAAVIGERWAVGSAVLEVAQPRIPCFKLGIRFGDPGFPRRFAAAGRPGAYLRIVTEGDVGAGDRITVLARPGHGVTVGLVERAYHADRSLARRFVAAPALPEAWLAWGEHVMGPGSR